MNRIEELAKQIKNERLKRRLSIRQLAARAGVSYSYLARLERGGVPNNIKASTLDKLANALKISNNELYKTAGYSYNQSLPFDTIDLKQIIEHNQTITFDGHKLDNRDIDLIKRILTK